MGRRTGLIEQAQEGTVLFDDIADLPLDAQKGVLRFLQTGKIQPLGGQEEKIIDARVWRPRTAIFRMRSRPVHSARICISASTSCRWKSKAFWSVQKIWNR